MHKATNVTVPLGSPSKVAAAEPYRTKKILVHAGILLHSRMLTPFDASCEMPERLGTLKRQELCELREPRVYDSQFGPAHCDAFDSQGSVTSLSSIVLILPSNHTLGNNAFRACDI